MTPKRNSQRRRKRRYGVNVAAWAMRADELEFEYITRYGASTVGQSEDVLTRPAFRRFRKRVQLIFTSPPFPLNRKKRYGNAKGDAYKNWLKAYAKTLLDFISEDGSIVIELGNAWEPGKPVMSTLALESLLAFKEAGNLHLCQEFIWYNTAKLPTPAQWVNIERIRVKDAFTRLWWLSPSERPKADNRRVLTPYSRSMKSLLRTRKYNAGKRPSEHVIGETSFLTDNGGAIPPNVIQCANTGNDHQYQQYCREVGVAPHPTRMPADLAEFFILLCTDVGDIVMDPFAGSNTTGAAAEALRRQWVSIEANPEYACAGFGRFTHEYYR